MFRVRKCLENLTLHSFSDSGCEFVYPYFDSGYRDTTFNVHPEHEGARGLSARVGAVTGKSVCVMRLNNDHNAVFNVIY